MIDSRGLPIKTKINYHITVEEVRRFFASFLGYELKFKILFLLQFSTGLRIGEALCIKIDDFVKGSNFTRLMVRLEKKRKFDMIIERVVPDFMAQVIREYVWKYPYLLSVERNPESWLFPCLTEGRGGPRIGTTNAHVVFGRVRKRAGLDECIALQKRDTRTFLNGRSVVVPFVRYYRFNTHSLRRLFITRHNKELRLQPHEIALIVGHENSRTTERYISEKAIFDNARIFANDLFGKDFWQGISLGVPDDVHAQIKMSKKNL